MYKLAEVIGVLQGVQKRAESVEMGWGRKVTLKPKLDHFRASSDPRWFTRESLPLCVISKVHIIVCMYMNLSLSLSLHVCLI